MHVLPSGVLNKNALNIIGSGVVVGLEELIKEFETLNEKGINPNVIVSDKAPLLMPWHKELDRIKHQKAIGTTGKGIGPAYEDLISRSTLRFGDFLNPNYSIKSEEEIKRILNLKISKVNEHLKLLEGRTYSLENIYTLLMDAFNILNGKIQDTSLLLEKIIGEEKVLFEGAQGTLLDIIHGTYPYVTSSNTTVGGVLTGTGISLLNKPVSIIGIFKAYMTRVGEGPFVTELNDDLGSYLREKGHEFGATTKRPRRTGWFDIPLAKYSLRLNGFNSLALTKLDVLSGLEEIKVAIGYRIGSNFVSEFNPLFAEHYEPVYVSLKGWEEDISNARTFYELPKEAQNYVKFLERHLNAEFGIISVGPDRTQTIYRF